LKNLKNLFNRYRNLIVYLILGVLTTCVNYAVYLPLYNWLRFSATFSNVIAWVAAVIFAFVTNKPFAFGSHDWSWETVFPEAWKFVGCRIGSGLFETAVIFIFVDFLAFNGNVVKLITSVAVVIFNYFASKLFVFKR
jgi:putative flippase GtrA